MKKEIFKKNFQRQPPKCLYLCILCQFIRYFGSFRAKKRHPVYSVYPPPPPHTGPEYGVVIFHSSQILCFNLHMGPPWHNLWTEIFRSDNLTSTNLKPFLKFNSAHHWESKGSFGRALDCWAAGRGIDSQGRNNTQGLKITEKWRYSLCTASVWNLTWLGWPCKVALPSPVGDETK